jgi:dTDP-4-dehydrorhamnose reductase
MIIGIVGSNGTLGRILSEQLSLRGHELRLFSRQSEVRDFRADVLTGVPPAQLSKVDCVIYLAWATTDRSTNIQNKHAEAAGRWAKHCDAIGVKFLFVSTVLAHEDTRSKYGEYKLKAEKLVAESNGKSVRIGSVVDDAYPLLLTKLRSLGMKMPWVGSLFNWPIYAVSSTTVATIIEQIVLKWSSTCIFWCAPSIPTNLATIMLAGSNRRVRLKGLSRLMTVVARFPIYGTKMDALRGLVGQIPILEIFDVVEVFDVKEFDWKSSIYGEAM